MIGIYRIKNKVNNKCYYGSSKNIDKRWKRHKNELNKKKHINIILQRAWNKYGEKNFVFEIIEECDVSLLLKTEQNYLNLSPEYNIGIKSSGGDNLSKNPNKKNIVDKIKKSLEKHYNLMTDSEIKEKYSKPLGKNPNWKGGKSFIYCKCGKRIGYTNKTCINCKDKSGEYNPFFGKKHTKKTKKILSEKRMGTYNGEQNIPIIIDDVEYRSAGEASKVLNIPMVTIRWRVLSKNKKFENYGYKKP
jgi:group I intron endonuclease